MEHESRLFADMKDLVTPQCVDSPRPRSPAALQHQPQSPLFQYDDSADIHVPIPIVGVAEPHAASCAAQYLQHHHHSHHSHLNSAASYPLLIASSMPPPSSPIDAKISPFAAHLPMGPSLESLLASPAHTTSHQLDMGPGDAIRKPPKPRRRPSEPSAGPDTARQKVPRLQIDFTAAPNRTGTSAASCVADLQRPLRAFAMDRPLHPFSADAYSLSFDLQQPLTFPHLASIGGSALQGGRASTGMFSYTTAPSCSASAGASTIDASAPLLQGYTFQALPFTFFVRDEGRPVIVTCLSSDDSSTVERAVAVALGRPLGTFGLRDAHGAVSLTAQLLQQRGGPFTLVPFQRKSK
jgi:hypothetical protein